MRQRHKKTLFAFLLALVLVFCVTVSGLADAGGFSSGSDYGGGGGAWGLLQRLEQRSE